MTSTRLPDEGWIAVAEVNGQPVAMEPVRVKAGDMLRFRLDGKTEAGVFTVESAHILIEHRRLSRWQRLRRWVAAKMQAVMGGG